MRVAEEGMGAAGMFFSKGEVKFRIHLSGLEVAGLGHHVNNGTRTLHNSHFTGCRKHDVT